MDQTRQRTSRRWLLAVPALTGAAGGAAALAAELAVLVTALGTAAVLWRAGRRSGGGLHGWTLLSLAVLLGLAGSAVAGVRWPGAETLSAAVPGLVHVPAVLLAVAGVLTLLTRAQLRAGGARLVTETALFFSAAMVLAQVLVVGPVFEGPGLDAAARTAIELSCGATAALLSAVLVLVSASPDERRSTGALLLLAATTMVAGRALDVVAQAGQPVPAAAAPAALIAGLLLVVVAVLRDRGPDAGTGPSTARATRLTLAGQVLPHLVTVLAALAFVGSAVLGASHTPTAASAVLAGLVLTAVHRAVTARDEARVAARLHRSESYFRSLVRSSSDAVLILDGDLRVTWAAPALADAVAATGTELRGNRLTAVVHPDDAEPVATWLTGTVSGAGPTGLRTFRLPAARGSWRVLEAGVSDLRADADVAALVLHCRDVTARLDREDELHSIAFTDPLTGLPNRAAQLAALGSRLGALNDRADAQSPEDDADDDRAVSLLVVELQGLHELHDLAGSDLVDQALVEVARRLRGVLRNEDQVARVAADSFSILALGTTADADRVASRCLSVIEQPLMTDVGLVDLTAALGLVPLSAGLSERDALDRAELAVRAAHAAGPGTVRRYADSLGAVRDRREQLRRDLVGARERGELALAWQPIVALSDHRVTGIEASLRWRHPVYGDVPPEEFLAVAARAGLEVDLQRWVLREATRAAAGLPDHEPALKLGVDVSMEHLAAGTLVGDVSSALEASGLPPERLVLEIREAAVALAGEREAADVTALRLMGVHLALDDFGSGQSSLSQITRLPIDVLKLDRSFLSRIDRDRSTRAICQAVVGIGASLGVDIVAQGVETTAQLAVLEQLGCGYVQGFLLSRPVGTAALVELLDRGVGQLWPGVPGRV
ncbi:putative bifunctional diguanylate cyclase/phosphodiesterase [Modestobacter sp. URMC 112]